MSKGEETRRQVLEAAVEVAASGGLAALTIGSLAERTGMSKSGLFAHFKSKEALQVQALELASEAFVDDVVRPALSAPRGEKRITTLFESWLAVSREGNAECLFVSAAWEYDDQPGLVRDRLVRMHRDFNDALAQMFRTGISEGFFASGADPEQFAHDLHGIMLVYFQAHRLLGDAKAEERARHAFARLIESNR